MIFSFCECRQSCSLYVVLPGLGGRAQPAFGHAAYAVCMMARMVRTVRTVKVAVAWKVAAEHGGCWASSHHPGGLVDGCGGRGNVLGHMHV